MGNSPVAGDKRKRSQLTLHSLPYEVILSIVEWTAQITLEDQLEQERLNHEQEHEDHHHHHHGPLHHHHMPPGFTFGPVPPPAGLFGDMFPGQNVPGNGAVNPEGIGDIPFMQNLMGFLNNGGTLVNIPVPAPAAAPTPTPVPTAPANPQTNDIVDAGNDTDEEMPPLEPMGTPALGPTPSASSSGPSIPTVEDNEMPPLEPADILIPTSVGTTAPTVPVEDDLDEMPTLEPTQQGEPLPPTNTENAAMGADTPPPANQTLAPPPLPPLFTLSDASFPTVPLTGALASEFSHMQQGTGSYTAAELEDMPDMASPAVTPGQASFSNESDWATEEDDSEEPDELEDEGVSEEEDTVEDDDEEDEDDDDETHTDEGHGSLPYSAGMSKEAPYSVSYEDGLPSCPYLPLALVNRSFLNAARTLLYGRHIHLVDTYQAHLLLRTLTSPQVSVCDDEPDADDEDARQQNMLSYLVRDVAFDIRNLISLGRGGGSLLIDIIRNCPRIERIAYNADFTRSAQKPLEAALAGCPNMRAVHLRGGDTPAKDLVWEMRNLALLLSKWSKLDNLQVLWLKHSINGPLLPAPKIQLTRLSLAYLDITDSDLVYLLKGSKGSLKTLDLHKPSIKLTREGVARVLIEHGATLTSFQLDVRSTWHPTLATASAAEASALSEERAAKCKYLMDGLIGHLKVLSELKLSGSLASTILFARLPRTISVLAFEDNMGLDMAKVLALLKKKKTATNGKSKKTIPIVAPKLRCFTVARSDGAMLSETMMNSLEKLFDQRKACVHWSYHSPMSVWRPDGTTPPPAALGMMGGLLGMAAVAGGAPFPPDFDFDGFAMPMPPMF